MQGTDEAQCLSAGVECGTGGQNVVDDYIANIGRDVCGWISFEGLGDISSAFGPIQKCLRWCGFYFDEGV